MGSCYPHSRYKNPIIAHVSVRMKNKSFAIWKFHIQNVGHFFLICGICNQTHILCTTSVIMNSGFLQLVSYYWPQLHTSTSWKFKILAICHEVEVARSRLQNTKTGIKPTLHSISTLWPLKALDIWNAHQVYSVECVHQVHFLSYLSFDKWGCCFSYPCVFWWLWEFVYFIVSPLSNLWYESSAIV